MKKLICLALVLVMIFTVVACGGDDGGGASDGPIKVGIINNPPSESGYRAANVKSFEDVFTAENGYEVQTFYDIENDPQLNAARDFINAGVDYLLISAAATTGWDSVLRDAQEAGIAVFLFDRMIDVDQSLFTAAVVSDMRNQGIMAVEALKGLNLPEYNIIHIQGAMGSDAQIGRTEPLNEAVAANDNWNIVVQQTATWDEAVAMQITQTVIASGEPFNVIYAENDGMARGAVAALTEAGITHGLDGDVVIIGVDANRWALEEVLAGNWNFNIQCSPFQAEPIHQMIQTLEAGGTIANKIVINEEIYFDARTITQADVDTYGLVG